MTATAALFARHIDGRADATRELNPHAPGRGTPPRDGARPRRSARADRLRPRRSTGSTRWSARGEQGYVCVCNVHTVMASDEDPELRAALLGLVDQRPRRAAARVGDQRARPLARRPRLRAGADVALLRARRRPEASRVPVRRPQPGRARAARAQPSPALPGRQDRRRLLAPAPAADRRGGATPSPRRSTARAPTSCGSGSACPSRRSGWRAMRPRLEAPVLIGVGAAFDFHAGLVPQAPNWIQEAGLEWAYRLAHEPRRLWRRYLRYNPRFLSAFARQFARHRSAARHGACRLTGFAACQTAVDRDPDTGAARLPGGDARLDRRRRRSSRRRGAWSSATGRTPPPPPSPRARGARVVTLPAPAGLNAARNAGDRSRRLGPDRVHRRRRRGSGRLARGAARRGARTTGRRRVRRSDPRAARGRRPARLRPRAGADHDARPRPGRPRRRVRVGREHGHPPPRVRARRVRSTRRIVGRGDEEEWQRRYRAGGGRIRYLAAAGLDHRRTARGRDRAARLSRAAYALGRTARRNDVRKGTRRPPLRGELRTLAGCCWHIVRRRCAIGIVMAAHTAGRLREAVARAPHGEPANPAGADFLSGASGQVLGVRATGAALRGRRARRRVRARYAASR